jgi:hypothetical protein
MAGAVLVALAVACGGGSTPPAPTATPTDTGGTPAASPTSAPTTAALLDEVGAVVEELRGIRAETETVLRIVDEAGMRDALLAELDDPETTSAFKRQGAVLRLLGLLPPDADLRDIYGEFVGEQVLGLYLPESGEMLVLAGDESAPGRAGAAVAEMTLAHEYVHLLQDRRYDLARMRDEAGATFDRGLALSALIEGDATETSTRYVGEYMDAADALALLVGAVLAGGAGGADMPPALAELTSFPYLSGAQFATELRAAGGQAAVDAAFADPPTTTEQVLHPEKYLAGQGALPVSLPPLADALGDGWEPLGDEVLGERLIELWFTELGGPEAAAYAGGWGGDAARLMGREAADGWEYALGLLTRADAGREGNLLLGLDFALRLGAREDRAAVLPTWYEPRPRTQVQQDWIRLWSTAGGVLAHSAVAFDDYLAVTIAPDKATALALMDAILDGLEAQQLAAASSAG